MATTHPPVDRPLRVRPARLAEEPASRPAVVDAAPGSPSLLLRAICLGIRAGLVVLTLLVGLVAGGVFIVPLMILAPPLPVILAGLAVVYVLGATSSMADDWHVRRQRR